MLTLSAFAVFCHHLGMLVMYVTARHIPQTALEDGRDGAFRCLVTTIDEPPLTQNQVRRILQFIFEAVAEQPLLAFFKRYPDLRIEADRMRFPPNSPAETLRRRARYIAWFEPEIANLP